MFRIILIGLLISGSAYATPSFDCDVVKVQDDNVFEEGLGETGSTYADEDSQQVRLRSNKVSIGQFTFDDNDEDTSVSSRKYKRRIGYYYKIDKDETYKIKIYLFNKTKLGVILVKDYGSTRYNPVASIDCNDYSETKKYITSGEAELKRTKFSSLSKKVRSKIRGIDVAVELGDGYYDVVDEKLYEIIKDNEVVGYKLDVKVYYTEDDEILDDTVYFLANGVRFQGPGNYNTPLL